MISCKIAKGGRTDKTNALFSMAAGERSPPFLPVTGKEMQANPKAADRPQLLLLPDLSGLSITLNYSTSINTLPETF